MKKTLQIQIPEGFKIDNFDINSGVVKFTPIPKNIIERVKSIDDAINELGETDVEVAELRKLENANITSHILYKQQAVVIAKALNEGWIADYTNIDQTKYEPRFYYDSSAGGFVFHDYGRWSSATSVGSRLCFHSSKLAKYFGTQFIDIYRKYL